MIEGTDAFTACHDSWVSRSTTCAIGSISSTCFKHARIDHLEERADLECVPGRNLMSVTENVMTCECAKALV